MAIANVILTNTFDEWRTRTNQTIVGLNNLDIVVPDLSDKTNTLYTYANTINDKANVAYIQANTARDHANAAFNRANIAHSQANTARDQANVAFNQANAAFTQANVVYVQANTARDHANAAFNRANIAHSQANTARDQANAAFDQANVAFNQANVAYVQANTARTNANAAFMQANAAFAQANAAFDRANVITTTQIVNGAVTADKLASSAVTAQKIAVNSVDGTKIALGSDAQGDLMYYNGTDWARLPAGRAGQVLVTNGSGSNPVWSSGITTVTPSGVAPSGSSFDITNIPSDAMKISIIFYGVSVSAVADILVQIGGSAGVENTPGAYFSTSTRIAGATPASASNTSGYVINVAAISDQITCVMVLNKVSSSSGLWISTTSGSLATGTTTITPGSIIGGGYNAASVANITTIRIRTVSGSFTGGSIFVICE